jgi:outer membrane cobalamin receptor
MANFIHLHIMKKICIVILFPLMFIGVSAFAQKITIHGYITDRATGERTLGASIIVSPSNTGTTSNNYGFYSITVPKANDSIEVSYSFVGYQSQQYKFPAKENKRLDVLLSANSVLEDVIVTSSRKNNKVISSQMSTIQLNQEQIKNLPAMLGEADVLRAVQLLPGIQAGNEGNVGFYVRGGGADQNLILLDGVPVYNAMHLFGFFSVFNSDALQTVDVIKGGFPARYGGRLSSVLDIRMKEGNNQEFHGEGGLGLLAARLMLEGPVKKGKSSFMVSGRRTYADLYMRPLIKSINNKGAEAGYYFYDLNAKVNFYLGKKDHLYFSGYFGNDKFDGNVNYDFNSDSLLAKNNRYKATMEWGNSTAIVRWNHEFSRNLFCNMTFNYTKYQFNLSNTQNVLQATGVNAVYYQAYSSGIEDKSLRIDLDYLPNPNHFIKIGTSVTRHNYRPGAFQTQITNSSYNNDSSYHAGFISSSEFDTYAEDDIRFSNRIKANVGLHLTGFWVRNNFFTSLQPRVSLRYLLRTDMSLKVSFAQMNQFIHLLTNNGVGMPTDLWVPATGIVPPEKSLQAAIGWQLNWKHNIEFGIESYYKKMDNVIEYKEGSSFVNALNNWENQVVTGTGTSYGIEWMAQKQKGRTTGLIGYTLSWSDRQFADLNNGQPFPYKYDRRHDLKLAVVHALKKNIQLSADWVFSTGIATTLPVATYLNYSLSQVQVYDQRNSFRLPPYHRLDISIKFSKQKKNYERDWIISIYNVYNRLNAYFIYQNTEYDAVTHTYANQFYKFALFPIIPSISYQFKF